MNLFKRVRAEATERVETSDREVLKLVNKTKELSVFRNTDGEWVFRLNKADTPAYVKTSSDYSQIGK